MKRAIVIGGSGFLGGRMLKVLASENVETLVTVNKTAPKLFKGQSFLNGGIKAVNTALINEFKPELIFHCGRPTLPKLKKLGRNLAAGRAYRLNKQLIRQIEQAEEIPKLVFASGSLMYGSCQKAHDESAPLKPISYARQYSRGEQPLLSALSKKGLQVLILRFPWLLGNGSWFRWFYYENIKKQNTIPKFGSGNNRMEIVDAMDAAILMHLYAEEDLQSGIYNIFAGNALKQSDFLVEIKSVFGGEIKDYQSIFPKGIEKEAREAFTSNILLKSNFNRILEKFQFTPLKTTLEKIKTENESDHGF